MYYSIKDHREILDLKYKFNEKKITEQIQCKLDCDECRSIKLKHTINTIKAEAHRQIIN